MYTGKRILYLLVFVASLLACNSPPEKPLRVGTIPWAGFELLYLARDLRYYDNTQIQLKELASSTETLYAFRQGQLDAIAITLDEALRLTETQSDLKVILIFNISNGADKLIVHPEINSLQDLRNKRIAIEKSGVGTLMLMEILQLAGLEKSDITLVPATINQHFFMMENQQVDAAITFDPVAHQLEQLGYINLIDSKQIPVTIIDVLVTRDKALEQQPYALQQLIEGYWKARHYMSENYLDALARMAPRLGVSADELDQLYQDLILPTDKVNEKMLVQEMESNIDTLSQLMVEFGLLEKVVDSRQLLVHETVD